MESQNLGSNIAKAIVAVMQSVKGIEKNTTVGTGSMAYKGVSDKDVKNIVGQAMADNGLVILPVDIDAKTTIERWVEKNQYGEKQKQQVFSEVKTKYLLLHESGEYVTLSGYGHGADTQDKSAGKATTYALKYTLLYTFLVPTGDIDDTDSTHSEDLPTKPAQAKQAQAQNQATQAQAQAQAQPQAKEKAKSDKTIPQADTKTYKALLKLIEKATTTEELNSLYRTHVKFHTEATLVPTIQERKKAILAQNEAQAKQVA